MTTVDVLRPAAAGRVAERAAARRLRHHCGAALAAVLTVYVGLAVTFAWLTPAWRNNDEADHILYVEHVARTGTIPRIAVANGIESHQGPLYYYLAAGWQHLLGVGWIDPPQTPAGLVRDHAHDAALREMRLLSVLIGAVAVAAVFWAGWLLSRRVAVATAAAAVVGLWPKFLVVASAVTNSVLVDALLALAVPCWIVWWRSRSLRWAALVGVLLGGAVLAQVTALPVAAVMLAGMVAAWSWQPVAAAAGSAAAVCGWWFARNWAMYGDPLANAATNRYLTQAFGDKLIRNPPRLDWPVLSNSAPALARSVWYDAGWNDVHLHSWIDYTLGGAALATVAAALLLGRRRAIVLLAGCAAASIVAWLLLIRQATQAEGRYLLIAVAAWALLLVAGTRRLRLPVFLWPAAFAAVDVLVLARHLIPGRV